jgi:hypothetical protein
MWITCRKEFQSNGLREKERYEESEQNAKVSPDVSVIDRISCQKIVASGYDAAPAFGPEQCASLVIPELYSGRASNFEIRWQRADLRVFIDAWTVTRNY